MTQLIAMIAGPYLAVTGVGFLLSTRFYELMASQTEGTDRVVVNLSGAVHFLAGLVVLVLHFRWGGLAESMVTLIGVAALLKGAALIMVPELTLRSPGTSRTTLRLSALAFISVGAYLVHFGYFGPG